MKPITTIKKSENRVFKVQITPNNQTYNISISKINNINSTYNKNINK